MTSPAAAWALRRAVRLAVGTCIVALVLATTLSGEAAERFATTAYLAALFAAIALIVQRFVPAPVESHATAAPIFPAFLAYSIGIVVLVSVAASLVSQPGAEAWTIVLCAGAVVAAVLARSGALAALHSTLVRGGALIAATRYGALTAVLALVFAALVGADLAELLAAVAYRLMLLGAIFLTASLLLPTSAGDWLRAVSQRATALGDRGTLVASAAAIAAMICASLLPAPYSEPFAVAAYAAALCAAVGVAIECRRLRG